MAGYADWPACLPLVEVLLFADGNRSISGEPYNPNWAWASVVPSITREPKTAIGGDFMSRLFRRRSSGRLPTGEFASGPSPTLENRPLACSVYRPHCLAYRPLRGPDKKQESGPTVVFPRTGTNRLRDPDNRYDPNQSALSGKTAHRPHTPKDGNGDSIAGIGTNAAAPRFPQFVGLGAVFPESAETSGTPPAAELAGGLTMPVVPPNQRPEKTIRAASQ